ncbi:F-box domain-containing protein [Mycena chlorophos]|uniref:F-box domain-containing protein n=1 Tax=Mycena chlorophos TaxID=658473 RepID=A0A8H6S321_MYCCL|nr:F-box domain-containing protein [Mycena chlorophos]
MSTFSSKLGTNYCPTEDDITAIHSILEEPITQLRHLDAKIADLQRSIDALIVERDAVASFVESHQQLLSPIRRVPPELLQEIFIACLPSTDLAAMSASEAPLLLTGVCSRWRDIATATPRLYSHFHVYCALPGQDDHYPDTRKQAFAWRLDTMKLWITRSHPLPLSISFSCSQSGQTTVQNWVAYPFFIALIDAAARWREIAFHGPEHLLNLPEFVGLKAEDVPLLRRLVLDPFAYDWPPPIHWNTAAVLGAPQLRSLRIESSRLVSPITLPIHWSTLTDLTLRDPSWENLFTLEILLGFIVPTCTSLRYLRISLHEHTPEELHPEPDRANPLVGPALRYLTLLINGPISPMRVLAYLSLPKLHTLRIFAAQDQSVGDKLTRAEVARFFATSVDLEGIFFDAAAFSKEELMALVHLLPTGVRSLGLRLNPVRTMMWDEPVVWGEGMGPGNQPRQSCDDEVLELLADSEVVCPSLEEFFIEVVHTATEDAILRFLLARQKTLKKARVKFCRPPSNDVEHQLLADRGFDISYPAKLQYPARSVSLHRHGWEGMCFGQDEDLYGDRGGW